MKKPRRSHAIKKLPAGYALGAEPKQLSAWAGKSTSQYMPTEDNRGRLSLDRFHRGYRSLWNAVILQAIQDACSRRTKNEYFYIRNTAQAWLNKHDADFQQVCDLAGRDYNKTIEKLLCFEFPSSASFLRKKKIKTHKQLPLFDLSLFFSMRPKRLLAPRQTIVPQWVQLELFQGGA